MKHARISLNAPPPTFQLQPGRIQRVTLAWWDPDEPEGKREPVLIPSPTAARTVVVVWPTDARGNVDLAALRAARGVEVTPWDLSKDELGLLRYVASAWPLDRHDLYVCQKWFGPCQDTLRPSHFWGGLGLDEKVEAAISALG